MRRTHRSLVACAVFIGILLFAGICHAGCGSIESAGKSALEVEKNSLFDYAGKTIFGMPYDSDISEYAFSDGVVVSDEPDGVSVLKFTGRGKPVSGDFLGIPSDTASYVFGNGKFSYVYFDFPDVAADNAFIEKLDGLFGQKHEAG